MQITIFAAYNHFRKDNRMQLSEQEVVRREKLARLREIGINPYPADLFPVDANSKEIKNNFEEGKQVVIAGRLMVINIQGKASFGQLQDGEGRIQLYFNRDEICLGEDKSLYKLSNCTFEVT